MYSMYPLPPTERDLDYLERMIFEQNEDEIYEKYYGNEKSMMAE